MNTYTSFTWLGRVAGLPKADFPDHEPVGVSEQGISIADYLFLRAAAGVQLAYLILQIPAE